jgi:hypothetical protein
MLNRPELWCDINLGQHLDLPIDEVCRLREELRELNERLSQLTRDVAKLRVNAQYELQQEIWIKERVSGESSIWDRGDLAVATSRFAQPGV